MTERARKRPSTPPKKRDWKKAAAKKGGALLEKVVTTAILTAVGAFTKHQVEGYLSRRRSSGSGARVIPMKKAGT